MTVQNKIGKVMFKSHLDVHEREVARKFRFEEDFHAHFTEFVLAFSIAKVFEFGEAYSLMMQSAYSILSI